MIANFQELGYYDIAYALKSLNFASSSPYVDSTKNNFKSYFCIIFKQNQTVITKI